MRENEQEIETMLFVDLPYGTESPKKKLGPLWTFPLHHRREAGVGGRKGLFVAAAAPAELLPRFKSSLPPSFLPRNSLRCNPIALDNAALLHCLQAMTERKHFVRSGHYLRRVIKSIRNHCSSVMFSSEI